MQTGCAPSIESGLEYQAKQIDLASFNLHDLGVADVNDDQRLDIFTTNHSAKQSLALNKGGLHFTDAISRLGLDQDHSFPGLALMPEEPEPDRPGAYINWQGTSLVVRSYQLAGESPDVRLSGTIDLLTSVELTLAKGFTVNVEEKHLPLGAIHSIVHFSGGSEGYFSIRPAQDAVPITFHIDRRQGLTPENIHLGPNKLSPSTTDFAIRMRDRHAMAWADFNGDGRMDVYIARGALSGSLIKTPLTMWDGLYIQQKNGMEDIGETVLPDKRGCPGRQAQWADYDNDGRLDILIVCGRGGFHSQLLRQINDRSFVDMAELAGLDLTTEGKFVWLDVNGDGYPDFVWADESGVSLYINSHAHFQRQLLDSSPIRGVISGLHISDIDSDGDADVFVATSTDSRVLVAERGTFIVRKAADFGLPSHNLAASWVDLDNDGVEEFYTVPDGIYRRGPSGIYAATGGLRWRCGRMCPYTLQDALLSWADLDNDGTRDLILATNLATKHSHTAKWISRLMGDSTVLINPFGGHWVAQVFLNVNRENHWLEINLIGPPGNRQGLGAKVSVTTDGNTRSQVVGHAEASRYSQGHYRVYFGLGRNKRPGSLSVRWPDGFVQKILDPSVDRIVTVDWASGQAMRRPS